MRSRRDAARRSEVVTRRCAARAGRCGRASSPTGRRRRSRCSPTTPASPNWPATRRWRGRPRGASCPTSSSCASRARMALFATVAGVRYCWRHRELADFEDLRAVVLAHGGVVRRPASARRRRRRGGRRAGGVPRRGASLPGSTTRVAHAELERREVRQPDPEGPAERVVRGERGGVSNLVAAGQPIYHLDHDDDADERHRFSQGRDALPDLPRGHRPGRSGLRPGGPAARLPGPSKILETNSLGGVELASTTQYYATATMVKKDTAEMSQPNFGNVLRRLERGAAARGLRRERALRQLGDELAAGDVP